MVIGYQSLGKSINSKLVFKHCLLFFNQYFSSFHGIFLIQLLYCCKWYRWIVGIPWIWDPSIIPILFYIHTFTFKTHSVKPFFTFQPFVEAPFIWSTFLFTNDMFMSIHLSSLFFGYNKIWRFVGLKFLLLQSFVRKEP